MKQIESFNPNKDEVSTQHVRDFWTENVNAERIMDKTISAHNRGEEAYFEDLEIQRYRSHRHLMPWMHSMIPGKTVLEIGCGVGLDSYSMAKHGMLITAMDLTNVGVVTANRRFKNRELSGNFLVGNACTLPFSDNNFNYVYSFGVLHHVTDTDKSIDEVYRVLSPGGQALIMLYHRHSLNELVHRLTRIPFEEKSKLCPVVRRYVRSEINLLFRKFSSLEVKLDFVYGEGYGMLFKLTPRWLYSFLSKRLGWHIMIKATK